MRLLSGITLWCLCVVSVAFVGGACSALDFNDVMLLKRNGVNDDIIAEQVRLSGGIAMSDAQATELRAAGASENLMSVVISTRSTTVAAPAATSPVRTSRHISIGITGPRPALCAKEGWLTVANHDAGASYYLIVSAENKRLFLSRSPNGGVEIPPGHSVSFNLRKETYKLYGDTNNKLGIKIREGEPTQLDLNPFGDIGLSGVARDRDRVRSEILFGGTVSAVVVRQPVLVAPPPPVFVPGPFYHQPRFRRHYYGPWW